MMKGFSCLLGFLICSSFNILVARRFPEPSAYQKSILHDAFGEILNLSPLSSPDVNKRRSKHRGAEIYMKQLFRTYKQKSENSAFNTIRSVAAKFGEVNGREALVFDVPSFNGTVINAEIHIDYPSNMGRHYYRFSSAHRKHRMPSFLHCLAGNVDDGDNSTVAMPLKTLASGVGKSDWYVFDATQILNSSHDKLVKSKKIVDLNVFSLIMKCESGTVNFFLSTRKMIRHGNPFLLLFTDERPSFVGSKNQFFTNIFANGQNCNSTSFDSSTAGLSERASDNAQSAESVKANLRVRRFADEARTGADQSSAGQYYSYYAYANKEAGKGAEFISSRDHHVIENVQAFSKQGPAEVLEDAREARRKRKKHLKDENRADGSSRFHGRFSRTGNSRNRRIWSFGRQKSKSTANESSLMKNDRTDNKVLKNAQMLVLMGKSKAKTPKFTCRKHDMVVEFADIGWADFIVAPTSFDAHYCARSCAFPLSKSSNPSNHAVIQSIIHAVGLHPGVPEISCAPDKMDSLTILYYDKRNNLVLKNYPRMTVESCSCL